MCNWHLYTTSLITVENYLNYYLYLVLLTVCSHVVQTQTTCWCCKEAYVPTPDALCLLNDKANIMHGRVTCCCCYRERQVISPHSAYAIERTYTTFTSTRACGLLHTLHICQIWSIFFFTWLYFRRLSQSYHTIYIFSFPIRNSVSQLQLSSLFILHLIFTAFILIRYYPTVSTNLMQILSNLNF